MNNKIKWINGLKGVAALVILIHHFALFFYPTLVNGSASSIKTSSGIELDIIKTPFNIFAFGAAAGISVFFTISGFLIAYNYFIKKKKYNANYIIIRYLKLMIPVLLTSILIFIILRSQLFRTDNLLRLYASIGLNNNYSNYNESFFELLFNASINLFGTASLWSNPPMWTMKYELIYSIFTVLLLNLIGKSNKRYFIYIMIFLISLRSYYLCFILGIVISDIWINKNEIFDKINRIDIKIIILILSLYFLSSTLLNRDTIYCIILNNSFVNYFDYTIFYHALGSGLLILFFILSDNIKKIFSKKIFTFFGNQSLYIYLFHWVIINTLSMYIVLKLFDYVKYYQAVLISFIISFIVVIMMSIYLGKYFNKIVDYFVSKIRDN